jgi:hypothetical protein
MQILIVHTFCGAAFTIVQGIIQQLIFFSDLIQYKVVEA